MSSNIFLENHSFYEIMWKNIVQPDRTHNCRRMRILCWIPTTANTHSEYVIFIAFRGNNGCTKASLCYVVCSLPVLFYLIVLIINQCCKVQIMK